jgi:hypothetical protein
MTTASLHISDSERQEEDKSLSLMGIVCRLGKWTPRHSRKPDWAHVSDRAWRRNSALLTYLHEARMGEG